MNIFEAHRLARDIMNQWGLEDWQFAFDNSVRRFGACHYNKKKITLSRSLVTANEVKEVIDVAKHEVSHALSWQRFGRDGLGHGAKWKSVCLEVGARPQRCYDADKVVNNAKPKYILRYKDSKKEVAKYFRRPKWANRVHTISLKSDPFAKGNLELVECSFNFAANGGIREFQFDD